MARAAVIAVIGAGDAPPDVLELALETGREIGARGATLVCGGRGGVMEAAARGAHERGGHTNRIPPGYDQDSANPFIEIARATRMGRARHVILVPRPHPVTSP